MILRLLIPSRQRIYAITYKNIMEKLYKTNYNFNISEFRGFIIRIFC